MLLFLFLIPHGMDHGSDHLDTENINSGSLVIARHVVEDHLYNRRRIDTAIFLRQCQHEPFLFSQLAGHLHMKCPVFIAQIGLFNIPPNPISRGLFHLSFEEFPKFFFQFFLIRSQTKVHNTLCFSCKKYFTT